LGVQGPIGVESWPMRDGVLAKERKLGDSAAMKKLLPGVLMLAIALLLTGCVRYNVTLSNGNVITAKSKPKLDKATQMYHFKDATGKEIWVQSMRIRSIEAR
jgi:hypothetical protein